MDIYVIEATIVEHSDYECLISPPHLTQEGAIEKVTKLLEQDIEMYDGGEIVTITTSPNQVKMNLGPDSLCSYYITRTTVGS